jgi:hypothetical protein
LSDGSINYTFELVAGAAAKKNKGRMGVSSRQNSPNC